MKHLSRRDRRESILIAAQKALARRGFLGTRTLDFAREAGVSCALLFRYFPTLKDLQRAVMERGLKRSPASWPKHLSRLQPRVAFKEVAAVLVGGIDQDPNLLRLALFGALSEVPDSALLLWRDCLRAERIVTSLIRTWKTNGWIHNHAEPTGLARLIVSSWIGESVVRHLFGIRRTGRSLNRMMDGVAGLLEVSVRAAPRDLSEAPEGRARTSVPSDLKIESVAHATLGESLEFAALDDGSGDVAVRRKPAPHPTSIPLVIRRSKERRGRTSSAIRTFARR